MNSSGLIKSICKLFCSIFICLMTGFLGSYLTADSVGTWYADLVRPSFAPPNWSFGVVWPVLYVMMGLSAFMIWNKGPGGKTKRALVLFLLQLILNGLWTPVFFGMHMIGVALFEIILLWATILLTIFSFWKISKPAAVILVPYLVWVSFAVVLNAGFWFLNK